MGYLCPLFYKFRSLLDIYKKKNFRSWVIYAYIFIKVGTFSFFRTFSTAKPLLYKAYVDFKLTDALIVASDGDARGVLLLLSDKQMRTTVFHENNFYIEKIL